MWQSWVGAMGKDCYLSIQILSLVKKFFQRQLAPWKVDKAVSYEDFATWGVAWLCTTWNHESCKICDSVHF